MRTVGPAALAVALAAITAYGCKGHRSAPEAHNGGPVSKQQRDAALAAARVWHAPSVPPSKADLGHNARGPGAFLETDEVDCHFTLTKARGTSPKFYCALSDGTTLKVKYGATNPELPAEVAATRLLEALGYPVDRMFIVRNVRCFGCPPFPYQAMECMDRIGAENACLQGADARRAVSFPGAVVERQMAGRKIETSADEGWAWYELDRINPAAGGSSRAEVDALRLMAVLLAHWDNKAENQRLLCAAGSDREDGSCGHPIAMIQDLGATFGPLKLELQNWRRVPMWTDVAACRVSLKALPFDGGTFGEHLISEEGRQFALRLLRQLGADQLRALFAGAGVTQFNHVLTAAHDPAAWVEAFMAKIDAIERAGPCLPAARLSTRGE